MPTATPTPAELAALVKAEAGRLGFAACGIVPVGAARSDAFNDDWLAAGYAGAMSYLHRHAPLKRDPRELLPEARSLIALAHPYDSPTPARPGATGSMPGRAGAAAAAPAPARGQVSRYAWGEDYHDVLPAKLARLAGALEAALGRPLRSKACVDTAPVLEREWAARSGLGWVGRNAMLINWRHGSWLFLAELLVDAPLACDTPPAPRPGRRARTVPPPAPLRTAPLPLRESCGSCTACLAACPTGAIVGDKTVDARRCISYLTIEQKGPVPRDLRAEMGSWVFGCDICQDVCPWNRRSQPTAEPCFHGSPEAAWPALAGLLRLDDAAFRARFRHTPLWRPRRRGILRNAAIALGNALAGQRAAGAQPSADDVAALVAALDDGEPLVRGAAAWALARAGLREACAALRTRLTSETDDDVRAELRDALTALQPS